MTLSRHFSTFQLLIQRHQDAAMVCALIGVYAVSWLLWLYPAGTMTVAAAIALMAFLASAIQPAYGVLMIITEVMIGSFGHLLMLDAFGIVLPLRILLFVAVIVGSLVWAALHRRDIQWDRTMMRSLVWLVPWSLAAIYGLIRALALGNDFPRIVDDANQWLFLAAISLLILAPSRFLLTWLLPRLLRASVVSVSILTLVLLYFFTHDSAYQIALSLYQWSRDTRIAEITPLSSSFTRIFIQSQLFLLIGWIAIIHRWGSIRHPPRSQTILAAILASAILLSMSRSFWLAMIVGFVIVEMKRRHVRFLAQTLIGATAIIVMIAYFPFPLPSTTITSVAEAVSNRTDLNESAVGSRWNLLPKLWHAALQHPILGSGFGATVTYHSRDPRILAASPDGMYTTHAFEWGLLDFWYKFGIIGIAAILFLAGWAIWLAHAGCIVSSATIAMLLATQAFSPYLNHPLGFTALALVSVATALQRDIGDSLFDKEKGEGIY